MAGQDVTIRIGGTTTSLSSALTMATADLDRLRQQMTVAADASKALGAAGAAQGMAWVDAATNAADYAARLDQLRAVISTVSATQDQGTAAIRMMTEQMQLQQETASTLADASRLLGDSYVQQAQAFLAASTSAQDYAARLDYLQTQMAGATAQQDQQSFSMGNLSNMFTSGSFSLSGLTSMLGDAAGPLGIVAGAIDNVVGSIGQFIQQSASMLIALVGWQALMDAANYVQQLTDQMFQLNEQTQKTAYSWKYLFGGGAAGMGISQNLMQWTAQASLTMPYTRQDIMSSITSLLTLPGMNESQIEKYLPMLSDLGASRASNLDLNQVIQAVVGAQFGYTRMLRYELHINPQDLVKYGLAMNKSGHLTDPSTLLPALMAYSQAHGYLGAGQDIAQNTWWGAWSSFVDRFQNAALELGGLSQNGMASPNSMFGALMHDLTGISSWWDAHQPEIKSIEDIVAHLVGGAVQGGGGLLGALFATLGQSGIVADASNWLYSMDQALQDMLGHGATSPRPTSGSGSLGVRRHPAGVDRWGQQSGAGRAHAATPNVFAQWGQDLAPVVTQALQLAEAFGQVALAVGHLAAGPMGAFLSEIDKSGIGQGVLHLFQTLGNDLNNPQLKQFETMMGGLLGALAGFAGSAAVKAFEQWADSDLKTFAKNEPAVKQAFDNLKQAFSNISKAITPQEKKALDDFAKWLAQVAGSAVAYVIVQSIAGAFNNLAIALNLVAGGIQGVNNIVKWLQDHANMAQWADDLKKSMTSWGSDMLDAFISGIQSKMGALNNAISGIAASIASKLHFSLPDEGPLADSDSWMPDMMRQLADGMRAGLPEVSRAAAETSLAIAAPMAGYGGAGGHGAGSLSAGSYSYSSSVADSRALHQTFYGASEAYMNHVAERAQRQFNHSSNLALRRPGLAAGRFGEIGPTPGLAR